MDGYPTPDDDAPWQEQDLEHGAMLGGVSDAELTVVATIFQELRKQGETPVRSG